MENRDWICEDVLSGKVKVQIIWKDDLALAFHHPNPRFKVHAMVVPKKHVSSLLDAAALDGTLLKSMVLAVQHAAAATGVDKTGFYFRCNAAFPEVTPHMHWHVIGVEPKE